MSQMIQRKQTRRFQFKAPFVLSVLTLTLSLWPQPKIAQAQWVDNTTSLTTIDNIGIGMDNGTTPATPATRLHVLGDTTIKGYIFVDGGDANTTGLVFNRLGVTKWNAYVPGGSNDLRFWDGVTDRITFQSGGNVGIGTTSPSSKLQVAGDLKIGSTNPLTLNKSAVKTFDLNMTNEGSAGHAFRIGLGGWGSDYFSIENSVHDTIYHKFTANGNSFLNAIGGNVGIGTTTPQTKLHVYGTDYPWFMLDGNGASGQSFISMRARTDASPNSEIYFNSGGNLIISSQAYANRGTPNGETIRFTVKGTGEVGIGTATPRGTLDVNGRNSYIGTIPVALGHASSGYPGIGYNFEAQVDGNWKYKVTDTAYMIGLGQSHRIDFNYAPLGTGGNLITWNTAMSIKNDGNIGIGTTTPDSGSKLTVNGNVTVTGNIAAKYQDVAEWVTSPKAMPAGTVVMLHPDRTNQVLPSMKAYDTRVAGVISDMPGLLLGEAGDGKVKVATTGRVKVKVDATKGPVQVGDLLVTSDKEGVAMKSEPMEINGRSFHQPGTILGKALEPLNEGEGEILVLLSMQ
ncbi:MAG: hypothetical protein LLH30_06825 [Candidatus Manganitrophus sp. SA1]|nr:hypothetical protein [Candidatus Manganitrophus morganii]